MKRFISGILGVALVLTGCGRSELGQDAEYFAGLQRAVVEEVLANPLSRGKIMDEPEATRESMAQGITRNFIVCRDALRVYRTWVTDGIRPDLAPLPTPRSPREPSHSDWSRSYAELRAAVDSGEIQYLRHWLTADGSCGEWIPAEPGDVSGPTVKDVVENLG